MTEMYKLLLEILLYAMGYVVGGLLGTFPVEAILGRVELDKKIREEFGDQQIRGAGRIIGILERIFTITCIYLNELTAITIIFAAKSIIRFESARQRPFAEYYLIGTLSSITYATLVGLTVKTIVTVLLT